MQRFLHIKMLGSNCEEIKVKNSVVLRCPLTPGDELNHNCGYHCIHSQHLMRISLILRQMCFLLVVWFHQ